MSVVLCGRHTWSVFLTEKHGLTVFENRVLRKMEFKNLLGQRVMATKESQCLTKQYDIYHEDLCGGGGTGPVILHFGFTHRGECSVCGRASPGK